MATKKPARMIVAASDHDPDMLYATRFFVPDAFVYLQIPGKGSVIALSDLEVDRGRAQASVDEVVSVSEESARLKLPKTAEAADFIAAFLKKRKVRSVEVPSSFPLGLAMKLMRAGIKLKPIKGLFFAEREQKSEAELKQMRRSLAITEAGLSRAMEVLRASKPAKSAQKSPLLWDGRKLTSELLRAEIDSAVLRAGGLPANTIVAGGEQACDPHERGSGQLRADELIILDIFPRDAETGYFGDMTRTVVRGRASEEQRKLWSTVQQGQKMALQAMKPGADGKAIHEEVKAFFTNEGYPTKQVDGRWRGFFHGTGHGLGLEIHESPRFAATKFKVGQVITVEPGIYWPGVGGARLEDVATITATGMRQLSRFPQELEL